MYFIDRTALGKTLAGGLQEFRGKDAVILCLKDSSLMTCLTMAIELRAWVYPLVYVPIYSEDVTRQPLGAINEEGTFCLADETAASELEQLPTEAQTAIRNQRQGAIIAGQRKLSGYGMPLNKQQMNGRDVILVGDVLTNTLPLIVANELLTTVIPKSLSAVVGNATPAVVDVVRISADKTTVLDVISGVVFDDDHYFEHPDAYTPEQKQTITQHIATFWH